MTTVQGERASQSGEKLRLTPVLGSADPEAGEAFLMPGPSQIVRELRVGPQCCYGVQFFGQCGLGKHGMDLPVTGGAQLGLGAELASS